MSTNEVCREEVATRAGKERNSHNRKRGRRHLKNLGDGEVGFSVLFEAKVLDGKFHTS
jgi:hypothetical protein